MSAAGTSQISTGPGGGEFFEVILEVGEVGAAFGDEGFVLESFSYDDVGHGEEEGDI